MSKLTLDEAIKHCLEVAGKYETQTEEWCKECAADHKQLAEWLTELLQRREWCTQYEVEHISDLERYDMLFREGEILNERYKEAKRLLKSAISEWPFVCEWGDCTERCDWYVNGQCSQEWSGKAEALTLIGEDGDIE
jgi:coenzyme F420-reducing hydrogenase gamma subunit